MKKKILFCGMILIALIGGICISTAAEEINSLVIYGEISEDGTAIDDVSVTVNLSNATTYDTLTDTTQEGIYQVNLDNMDGLTWDTGMTVSIRATYNGTTETETITLTSTNTADGMQRIDLDFSSATTTDDEDDDDDDSSSSTTSSSRTTTGNSTTYIVGLGAVLIIALIVGLLFFFFGSSPKLPPIPRRPVQKKNTKSYTKSGIKMIETPSKNPQKNKKKGTE